MLFTKEQIESMTSEQLANKVLTSGEALKALCYYRWSYLGRTVAEVINEERDALIRFFDVLKHNSSDSYRPAAIIYPFLRYVQFQF